VSGTFCWARAILENTKGVSSNPTTRQWSKIRADAGKMNEATVCAIVLDYRGAEKTRKCLLSLVGQGLQTVYVVDNSGAESSSAELRRSIERIRLTNPGFRTEILSPAKNLGYARGVNFALRHDSRSESPHAYYLLLNNDAVAGPGLVAKMIAEFHKDPDVVLVAPRIVSDDHGREFGIWYHRYFGLLLSRPGRCRFHYFTGCCLLFRKDLVTASGIFDESFFMYGEDTEFGWRIHRQGKKMVCATDVFVQHDLGPSVERTSFFYEYHMARGHLLLSLMTYVHPAEIPLLILVKYFALACRAVVRSLRYRSAFSMIALLLGWFPVRIKES
jgi:GT2 family glycosyltransferase